MYSNKKNAQYFPYLQTNLNIEGKEALFPYTGIDSTREYFCCQTGIADYIYKNRLSFSGHCYQELFRSLIFPAISQILAQYHAEGICYLVGHMHKEIVLVFQLSNDNDSPLDVANEVDIAIRRFSEEHLPLKNSRYCSTTVLSAPMSGINGIQHGCEQTEYLKRLSFFRMTPGVMTTDRFSVLKNKATYRDVMNLTRSLCRACAQGEDTRMLALCQELFLDILKNCYDMELVRDALSYLKHFLSIRLSVHLPQDSPDLSLLCNTSSYIIIEECYEEILSVLTDLCRAVQKSGIWSDTVANAAYFLRSNLEQDISLSDIAAFADTTPAYLSNIFHQQTGMTIKQYQQKIRMEQACYLLTATQELVTDIAAKTGFTDRRYFTRLFKEAYGMTPLEYRYHSMLKRMSQ